MRNNDQKKLKTPFQKSSKSTFFTLSNEYTHALTLQEPYFQFEDEGMKRVITFFPISLHLLYASSTVKPQKQKNMKKPGNKRF